MWKIEEIKHENSLLDQIHLFSDRISCRVLPNLGGSLQELMIDGVHIIDGISLDERGLEDYRNTFKSSILFPFPNRVKDGKFEFGEKSYQLNINDTVFNNAIHGLVYDGSFKFQKYSEDGDKVALELRYKTGGSHPGFAFGYQLNLCYSIANTGKVNLGFEVINTGHQTFPFGLGWHPYFSSKDLSGSVLSMEAKDHFVCPERMIPEEKEEAGLSESFAIGELMFDDGYSLAGPSCEFETPEYLVQLDFDYGDEPYLQIYTPPHRKSIAIEPMTCITDSFNNGIGLEALDPGQSYRWSIDMEIRIK